MVDLLLKGVKDLLGNQVHEIFEVKPPAALFEKLFNYVAQQIFTENYIKENKTLIVDILEKYLSKITYGDTLLKQLGAIYRHDTIDRLHLIKADTLILHGTADKLAEHTCADLLAENIPHTTLYKIPEAEHGFNFEKPDIFNKYILDFLLNTTTQPTLKNTQDQL
jgi:pimeloyl-ACP methyl ester carboxylesterase